ncbi:MAG TPA: hypothetical protein DCQ64_01770, partial [Candidatus Rokubacteria bacterium]|nr:hypothetical protein [Candidatus Rokubacteria bacterium]
SDGPAEAPDEARATPAPRKKAKSKPAAEPKPADEDLPEPRPGSGKAGQAVPEPAERHSGREEALLIE